MERLKEKQLTLRASRRPVEYNYTNADIHHVNTTPHDGYQFEYPVNWAGDPSTNKVIGIRRINYKPTSVEIGVQFAVENPDDDEHPFICDVVEVFTDQNTFEECIAKITGRLQQSVPFFYRFGTFCIVYEIEWMSTNCLPPSAPGILPARYRFSGMENPNI